MLSQFILLSLIYDSSMQEYYQKLCHLPGFVLLESTDRKRGRYDILSAYPYDSLKVNRDTKDITQVLDHLRHLLSVKPSVIDLPFQGGIIGYIGYDLGAILQDIHSMPQPLLQEMPLLDCGLYDWAIIVDHQLRRVSLFAANTHSSTPGIIDEVLTLWNGSSLEITSAQLETEFKPLITFCEYEHAFNSIHQSLSCGRSYQVNLTQPFHASYEGDSWEFYKKISKKNPVPFSAFLRTASADILSFSPERLLQYDQGKMITSPIKGTIRRSKDTAEDERLRLELLASEKNKAENVMIVDLLRNDLGKISQPNSVKVTSLCAIESYHSVHHLVSTIEAECLPEINPFDAFLSCFPGGSITGAPKRESMRIIDEEEHYARGIYCGSIGYFSHHGYFDTNIAIRTITAKDNILHLAAGGGIVIDSTLEDEYRECFLKIAAVIDGLQ